MPKDQSRSSSPIMQFALDALRADRNADYKTIAAAASAKGLKLVPIVFGRARLALGLAKKTKTAKTGRGPGRPKGSGRKPGRPKSVERTSARSSDIASVFDYVRGLEREVADLRARLERIAGLASV